MKGFQMITVIQDITLIDGTGGALIEDAVTRDQAAGDEDQVSE
jgi:hypothetical protein